MKRSEKLAFIKLADGDTYTRLKGFTELTQSKNPKEYSRQYVDEDIERTDVIGYSPEISYAFDAIEEDTAQAPIIEITDKELIGKLAIVNIVIVNLTKEGTTEGTFEAVSRDFSVIPSSEGDSTDSYTYSGSLKANGTKAFGTATTTDEWQTCTFTATAE
ncbi:MAG: hypothetical protein IJ007_00870 [Oscillospiraceae bacterium]|nr:hypothetical protein [Oscillospiraceae bacterium]